MWQCFIKITCTILFKKIIFFAGLKSFGNSHRLQFGFLFENGDWIISTFQGFSTGPASTKVQIFCD